MMQLKSDELASKIKSCDSISIDDYKNSGIDATPVDQYRLKAVLKNVEYLKNDIRK